MNQAAESGKKSFLRSFPSTFWVANLMELFERGAYYGLNALLAVYLRDKVEAGGLGFQEDEVGLLQGVVYAATYVVPILGGALADRYGYRRILLVAFSFLSAGYFLSGNVTSYWVIFATLLLMATGSGLFKPIITGTVAKTTNESNSGLGFGIYYWMINLGALIGPLVAGYLKGFSWRYVFFASSLYCAFMFLPTLFVFREPAKPEGPRKLKDVLGGAAMVLSNARFMLLIFVYSCFWILYFQNFGTVLWYLRDFIDGTPVNTFVNSVLAFPGLSWLGLAGKFKLDVEHVTVLNAGTIVLLQLAVSRIVKNLKPLPTMIAGIGIGALGFLLLASSQHVWIFLTGIAVFSVGEMTCHPKYYSYIGLVAPQEQKAVYMGYAFLYGVVGSLVGSNVGGEMYKAFLSPRIGQTGIENVLRNFWLVFAVLGGATCVLLFVYNRFFGRDTEVTRARARSVMFGVYGLLVLAAVAILYFVRANQGSVPIKTWIQAGIMAVVGAAGLLALRAVKKDIQTGSSR
jgi:dipeptide/tripeptide permease